MGRLSRMLGRIAGRFAPKKPICCLRCHYAFEERVCGPHLPEWAQKWLAACHKSLLRRGNPPELVKEHAEREMILFRSHCPRNVVKQIEADHEHLGGEV